MEQFLERLASTTELCKPCEHCGTRQRMVLTFQDMTIPSPLCTECANAEVSEAEEEEARKLASWSQHLRSDLGPRYAPYRFATHPSAEARDRIALAVEVDVVGKGRNLLIYGGVGTGKTGLATSAAWWLVEEHQSPVRFFVVCELLDLLRASYDEPNDAEGITRNAPFLVLDDLGAERTTPYALERLYALVNYRYRHRRPTIVTSNLTPTELIGHFDQRDERTGKRIVSRLAEDATKVPVEGPDLRIVRGIRAA